jgi:hypothetical protein
MGWLAVAVGVVAGIVPLAVQNALPAGDAITIAFVGVFAGIGLVTLSKVLEIAEKIETHTNWFSASARPDTGASGVREQPGEPAPSAPETEDLPEHMRRVRAEPPAPPREPQPAPEPQPVAGPEPAPEPEPQPEPAPVAAEPQPQAAAPQPEPGPPQAAAQPTPRRGPEVYDSSIHPPAVEEWSHGGKRVMTLQDGSVATEIAGVWQRFEAVEDMVDYLQQPRGRQS